MRQLLFSLIGVSFLIATPALAQFSIGGGVQVGAPYNEFRENTDAIGFGIAGNFFVPFGPGVPLAFGIEAGYMEYGRNSQEETLTAEIRVGNTVIDRLDIPLEIETTNSIIHGHAVLRASAPFPFVQPYIEGRAGVRYIATRTKVLDNSPDFRFSNPDTQDRTIVEKTNLDDYVFSYGGGGGFLVQLVPSLYLDLRVSYLRGGEAEYYDGDDTAQWEVVFTGSNFDPQNVDGDDLDINADPKQSETDMFFFTVGVSFKL